MMTYFNTKAFIDFCHKVFDHITIPIDFLDSDGRVMYVNEAFGDFLQMPIEELIGRFVTEVHPMSRFMEVLKDKRAEIAWPHKFENGKEAIVNRIPILGNNGELLGGLGIILFNNFAEVDEVMNKCRMLDRELRLYKNEVARLNAARYGLAEIVGKSVAIAKCKEKILKVAKFNTNVLVLGESGVGKELFAHAIHMESSQRDMPFVSINCSAIPENLLESELFGYEEGAFTGAKKGGHIGKFELANGGTIFLDEIGDMPFQMQVKILRVLQEKEIQRIGGKSSLKINIRVISATHRNLDEMVKQGKFREDLYYRLNVLVMEVPPLRERREDIPQLAEKFLWEFQHETGLQRHIPDNVMNVLKNYAWNGNVRELKNVIIKLCVNSDDVHIGIQDVPSNLLNCVGGGNNKSSSARGLNEIISTIEKELIVSTLKECNNNKSEAAKQLEIPRVTLYRKIEEHHIDL